MMMSLTYAYIYVQGEYLSIPQEIFVINERKGICLGDIDATYRYLVPPIEPQDMCYTPTFLGKQKFCDLKKEEKG